jgi:hypothetical protein
MRDLTGFEPLEVVFAGLFVAATEEGLVLRSVFEVEFDAGPVGSSRPSKARSSFTVNAVVVFGDLVSFLTVSASEAAGVAAIAMLEGIVSESREFAPP